MAIPEKGHCVKCGKKLEGRRRKWCSKECVRWYERNHIWSFARVAARRRDKYMCRICGGKEVGDDISTRLEVNHIEPRNGGGYGTGCWNHLENLETLCHKDHLIVTAQQRKSRKEKKDVATSSES